MSRKQKMIERLKSKPKDMKFSEAEALLIFLGYKRSNKGKTSGSRVIFEHKTAGPVELHRPHGATKELHRYQINKLLKILESEGLI